MIKILIQSILGIFARNIYISKNNKHLRFERQRGASSLHARARYRIPEHSRKVPHNEHHRIETDYSNNCIMMLMIIMINIMIILCNFPILNNKL